MVSQFRKSFHSVNVNESKILFNLMWIFCKIIMEKTMKNIFLNLVFSIRKIYTIFTINYHFYQKEWNLKKSKPLYLLYMIKMNRLFKQKKLKQVLILRLTLIKFKEKAWLKPYNDINAKLSKKSKRDFDKKIFFDRYIMHFLEKMWNTWIFEYMKLLTT